MSLARAVAWNTAVQMGGRILGLLASMLLTALLTRHLGLATYGQLVAASAYVALFAILGDFGLYMLSMRRAAQEPERRAAILGNALSLRLLLGLGAVGLAVGLLQLIPAARFPTYSPTFKWVVVVVGLNAYLVLISQFLTAIFRLHLRLDLAVWGEMLSRAVVLGAVLIVIATGGGLLATALAFAGGSVVNLAYAWCNSRRFEALRPRLQPRLSAQLLREGAVIAAVSFLGLVHFKVDTLLLSFLRTSREVGVYGVAYKLHEVMIAFPAFFIGLLYPVFSRLASEDARRLQQVFGRAFDVLLLAASGATLLVFVVAPDFAALLGAPDAALPMRILALALTPAYLVLGLSNLLLAESRQRWLLLLIAVATVVNIGANWVCIRAWSYVGAAGATVGTECLQAVCLIGYWAGFRRWRLWRRSAWGLLVAASLGFPLDAAVDRWMPGAGTALAHRLLGLAVAGLATLSLYLGALLAFRILPLAELRNLLPSWRTRGASGRGGAALRGGIDESDLPA